MIVLSRFFIDPIPAMLKWLGVAAFVVAPLLIAVHAVHAARAERQARCAAELRALKRDPFVQKFLTPADACLAVQIVTREMR